MKSSWPCWWQLKENCYEVCWTKNTQGVNALQLALTAHLTAFELNVQLGMITGPNMVWKKTHKNKQNNNKTIKCQCTGVVLRDIFVGKCEPAITNDCIFQSIVQIPFCSHLLQITGKNPFVECGFGSKTKHWFCQVEAPWFKDWRLIQKHKCKCKMWVECIYPLWHLQQLSGLGLDSAEDMIW